MANDRINYLNNIRTFLRSESSWLRDTLDSIGWNMNQLEQISETEQPELKSCPINEEHRMPETSLETHVMKCSKKYDDYPRVDGNNTTTVEDRIAAHVKPFLSSIFPYSKSGNFDIVSRYQSSDLFNSNSDVKNKEKVVGNQGSSTHLMELLSAERDAKRRRAAHRGKKIHTNKKSYTEIFREVIENEMKELMDNHCEDESGCSTMKKMDAPAQQIKYLGVGKSYYEGNPYKMWKTITEDEERFINRDSSVKHGSSKTSANFHHDRDDTSKNDRLRGEDTDRRPRKSREREFDSSSRTRDSRKSPRSSREREFDSSSRTRESRKSPRRSREREFDSSSRTRDSRKSPYRDDVNRRSKKEERKHLSRGSSSSRYKKDEQSLKRTSSSNKDSPNLKEDNSGKSEEIRRKHKSKKHKRKNSNSGSDDSSRKHSSKKKREKERRHGKSRDRS